MAAFDHWLNVLDIAFKAIERKAAVKAEEREERQAAKTAVPKQTRTQRAFGGAGVAVPKDPSCCLAPRRFK